MTLTLKIWSHLFRGQGGSRRGGWLLVVGGDSKTFAYMHIFAFQNNQQREQPSGLTARLWLTSAMVPQMKVSLTSLSIFIILGLRGMVLADCWYEVSRSILGRDYWSRTLLSGRGDCWYNWGEEYNQWCQHDGPHTAHPLLCKWQDIRSLKWSDDSENRWEGEFFRQNFIEKIFKYQGKLLNMQ